MLDCRNIRAFLRKAAPKERWVRVSELYSLIKSHHQIDSEDMRPTSHRDPRPRWERNVRAVLQAWKKRDIKWDKATEKYWFPRSLELEKEQGRASAKPSFSHDDVFPLIARLIIRAPSDDDGFVHHDTIVSAILADAEGADVVARARTTTSWTDDRSAASNMVAWFSQSITVGKSPWGDPFDRRKQGNSWSYKSKTAALPPFAADIELLAIEGEPRLFFHIRRERDASLARAKREAVRRPDGQLVCEACQVATQEMYPGLLGDICEVHHRRPLADAVGATATCLEDLAVLCANCHRAIHRTSPFLSVEEFRERFFGTIGGAKAAQQAVAADGPPSLAPLGGVARR